MVFRKYSPEIKVAALRMVLAGETDDRIRDVIGANVHTRTLERWVDLYEETRMVVRDPAFYDRRGRPNAFNDEDRAFIRALVADQPMLFLDEIREQIYDATGKLPCLEAVHKELKARLHLTLKKAHTSHIRKDFYKKVCYQQTMQNVPAELLVFTGQCVPSCERWIDHLPI